jgi:hypothetical protein
MNGELIPHDSEVDRSPEIRNGEEVARIVRGLYDRLGPKLGCRLVEPTVVLTVAGLKADADIGIVDVSDEEATVVGTLKDGPVRVWFRGRHGDRRFGFMVVRNDAATARLEAQQPDLWARAQQRLGELTENDEVILGEGLTLGYPVVAVIDFAEAYRTHRLDDLEDVDLLEAAGVPEQYWAAVPEFMVAREHLGHPEVARYIDRARAVLRSFYASKPVHQLIGTAEFQTAFASAKQFHRTMIDAKRAAR